MEISQTINEGSAVLTLGGRLDAFGSQKLEEIVHPLLKDLSGGVLVFDMARLSYLSSAGIRILLSAHKALQASGGSLRLAGLHGYCEQVLEMTGFTGRLPSHANVREALAAAGISVSPELRWSEPFSAECSGGSLRHCAWSNDRGEIRVLGHIEDVLYSRVTPERVHSKRFSETEYSIGLGALGDRPDDYLPLLGEMITIGGAMVWLPTDGHDTPDYLIPRKDTGEVTIRSGFNVSLHGDFNDLFLFETDSAGATLGDIYRDLFAWAKRHRPDFKGALEVTMRAEMASVFGSGILHSAIAANAPANGKMVTHPDNFADWFEVDQEPRHRNVTGLLTGIGIDLGTDLSAYDRERLEACFYLNPANRQASDQMLHNHGVFFSPQSFPSEPEGLRPEVLKVIGQGDFVDMRHLLDDCACTRALIGVSHVQQFVADPEARPVRPE